MEEFITIKNHQPEHIKKFQVVPYGKYVMPGTQIEMPGLGRFTTILCADCEEGNMPGILTRLSRDMSAVDFDKKMNWAVFQEGVPKKVYFILCQKNEEPI